MSTKNNKQRLRNSFFAQRDAYPIVSKKRDDAALNDQLVQLIDQSEYLSVHIFLPMRSEPNLYPFIQHLLDRKIKVSCPKSLAGGKMENYYLSSINQVAKGIFGTTYPANAERSEEAYDLIIVPGLAYSKQFDRLGYGGGYYDRFLQQQSKALKIAPAYCFQLVDSLPSEDHDIKMDKLLTP
ncbi:MAG: 5-formyltetrahydrofolate cyclo-ligase [Verrucomicrobia bacterium]|nr:5-formyltetrahydrofolate cyclo-ligase [Verrucomicrobiota bacterium]